MIQSIAGGSRLLNQAVRQILQTREGLLAKALPLYVFWCTADAAITVYFHGKLTSAPPPPNGPLGFWPAVLLEGAVALGFFVALGATVQRLFLGVDRGFQGACQLAAYLRSVLLLALMLLLPFFALLASVIMVLKLAHGHNSLILRADFIALTIVSAWLLLRLGLLLPAAAVGTTQVGLRESWARTAPVGKELFWIAVAIAIVDLTCGALTRSVEVHSSAAAALFDYAVWPIPFLVGLALSTDLYRTNMPS